MAHHRPISQKSSRSSSILSHEGDDGQAAFRPSFNSVKGLKREGHSDLNENSPLLSPSRFDGDRTSEDQDVPNVSLDYNDGDDVEQSKSVLYLFILTLSIGG